MYINNMVYLKKNLRSSFFFLLSHNHVMNAKPILPILPNNYIPISFNDNPKSWLSQVDALML